MLEKDVLELLQKSGAILEGHFLLASGLHSGKYVEKFRLLEQPEATGKLLSALAVRIKKYKPEVIVGPVTGGVILSFEMARQLGTLAYFTEKTPDGGMELRRGFDVSGKRVLLIEDIVTTGGSILKAADAVRECGGEVAAYAILADRSSGRFNPPEPVESMITLEIETFQPGSDTCPLCREGLELVKPGSGHAKK
ncbi:MAG: orotate phosphoribosyltransferase [Candidatus Electryonea clarkiae]|nr:orotate phosphoribosyltransferase [Candidatus Electryonea clarkiae]MDP8285224.1 orotate phosphoribosyltransferase [Candidatus Electryonea clarkiae]